MAAKLFPPNVPPVVVDTGMIEADAVTNAKLANMAAHTYKGNATAGSANPTDLTATVLTAELNLATTTLQGLLSTPHFTFQPRAAAATLTDANATITPLTDKRTLYVLPAATLTGNKTLTVDDAEGADRDFLFVAILDTSANTYRIQNQAAAELYTKAASPGAAMLVQFIRLTGAWTFFARYWIG